MRYLKHLVAMAGVACCLWSCQTTTPRDEQAEMDRFVSELMSKMTLREKLGQLNLPSGGDQVTGLVPMPSASRRWAGSSM